MEIKEVRDWKPGDVSVRLDTEEHGHRAALVFKGARSRREETGLVARWTAARVTFAMTQGGTAEEARRYLRVAERAIEIAEELDREHPAGSVVEME